MLAGLAALAMRLLNLSAADAETWIHAPDALLGLLPAMAAVLTAYIEFAAYEDDVREHEGTKLLFDRAQERLQSSDLDEQQEVIRQLGIEALQENANWALLHKTREVKPS